MFNDVGSIQIVLGSSIFQCIFKFLEKNQKFSVQNLIVWSRSNYYWLLWLCNYVDCSNIIELNRVIFLCDLTIFSPDLWFNFIYFNFRFSRDHCAKVVAKGEFIPLSKFVFMKTYSDQLSMWWMIICLFCRFNFFYLMELPYNH